MNPWFYSFAAIALLVLNLSAFAVQKQLIGPSEFLPRTYLAKHCKAPDCDFLFLDNVAWCESKWSMVPNSTSSAFGYFQILEGTEQTTSTWREGGSRMNPRDNIEMGIELYERDGIFPWMESRPCWHWRYQSSLYSPASCVGICS
jgi:hypothetical protein